MNPQTILKKRMRIYKKKIRGSNNYIKNNQRRNSSKNQMRKGRNDNNKVMKNDKIMYQTCKPVDMEIGDQY